MRGCVLVFARDPGGANAVVPVVGPLRNAGFDTCVYGKDRGLSIFEKYGIKARDMKEYLQYHSLDTLLGELKPVGVITGTSADDYTERDLWKICEKQNIPSIAILDQWMNYGIRFSKFQIADHDLFRSEPIETRCASSPSYIFVMDDLAKVESIEDGLLAEKLVVTGNPHLEMIKKSTSMASAEWLSLLNLPTNHLILTFMSEPITETYQIGKKTYLNGPHGYTEHSIFCSLKKSLDALSSKKKFALILKTHPKEDVRKWKGYLADQKQRFPVFLESTLSSTDLICGSDLILGMSTMVLMEASLAEKPVMSIQIGLKNGNPYVLERMGLDVSAKTEQDLDQEIEKFFTLGKEPVKGLAVQMNSIENVINVCQEVFCKS